MLDDYNYHYDKYDKIKEYDGKDRSEERTEKCCCVGKEAAGGRNMNKSSTIVIYTIGNSLCPHMYY